MKCRNKYYSEIKTETEMQVIKKLKLVVLYF